MGLGASTVQQHIAVSPGAPFREWSVEQRTGKELIIHPAFASPVTSGSQEERIRAIHLPEHLFRIILLHLVKLDEPRASVQSILSLSAASSWLRSLCMEPEIWQELCCKHFQAPRNVPVSSCPWYQLYRFNHEGFKTAVCGHRNYGPQGIGNGRVMHLQA